MYYVRKNKNFTTYYIGIDNVEDDYPQDKDIVEIEKNVLDSLKKDNEYVIVEEMGNYLGKYYQKFCEKEALYRHTYAQKNKAIIQRNYTSESTINFIIKKQDIYEWINHLGFLMSINPKFNKKKIFEKVANLCEKYSYEQAINVEDNYIMLEEISRISGVDKVISFFGKIANKDTSSSKEYPMVCTFSVFK